MEQRLAGKPHQSVRVRRINEFDLNLRSGATVVRTRSLEGFGGGHLPLARPTLETSRSFVRWGCRTSISSEFVAVVPVYCQQTQYHTLDKLAQDSSKVLLE